MVIVRAVGIAFLWADLANYFGVGDFGSAVGWDVFESDDKERVGSLDTLACAVGGGADTLTEAAEFVGVGVVPDLVEVCRYSSVCPVDLSRTGRAHLCMREAG